MKLNRIPVVFILVLQFLSCMRKDEVLSTDPSDRLEFSEDTVFFDTLFSSVGSITKRLLVYNPGKNKIRISSVTLAGGSNSAYSVIVNGLNGPSISDIDIRGNDSIYVLVKVLIDPSNQDLPFLVSDSILFYTNTNRQKVLLSAYGQDAHFFGKESIACDAVWVNDKPYVLYDTLQVNTGCTLTIQPGCKIYFHTAAALNVRGTLIAQGSSSEPLLFASDKLSKTAQDDRGQWGGLIFQSSSSGNVISWATIRNSSTAIKLFPVIDADTIAELSLDHTFLLHASVRLIDAQEVDLAGSNLVLSDCPKALLKHTAGCGVWKHCTFANYSSGFFREETNLVLGSNMGSLKMYVLNSILWGDKSNEVTANNTPSLSLQSCIWRSAYMGTNTNVITSNPLFSKPSAFDFSLTAGSSAIDLCTGVGVPDDIAAGNRDSTPDAGAYEFK
ncbi:hypothetical protein [Cytophaga hutchinsonii]|uniref:Uncharacterized protein n=1 Tax=Cytophaga hutchinsonii (strain ATCC 33406 / DSM 1761 / CIP 103989 / NBRC 15051 / NCIMB 9469 / D465) TaxID=269798 RepID=A0A6N4SWR3_CYTH3|nr:hypothetical protein [Cytophaga hutchinsonii]ABG60938.1 conserved hypothetical protein [Cytophaga hutchinsonii ATCC 33406]